MTHVTVFKSIQFPTYWYSQEGQHEKIKLFTPNLTITDILKCQNKTTDTLI